jgi:hypothetical protein
MPRHLALRRIAWFCSAVSLFVLPLAAQSPVQSSPAVPVSQEPHHHLVLKNSYVRAYYVDVAPHESTLRHRHDLPYFAVLLSGDGAPAAPAAGAAAPQPPQAPRAIYSPGGISHAVSNPGDTPFRNVTVELLRPQGKVRNRCDEIVRGQPLEQCDIPTGLSASNSSRYAVFETDEILVEYWKMGPAFSRRPWDDRHDILLIALNGWALWAADASANAGPASGVLWFEAGSKVLEKIKFPPAGLSHRAVFVAITFKDSAPASR